jgi:hypothetical protein
MELTSREQGRDLHGQETFDLEAGEGIRIQKGTVEDPEVVLLEAVPGGKKWTVRITVAIEETDAA